VRYRLSRIPARSLAHHKYFVSYPIVFRIVFLFRLELNHSPHAMVSTLVTQDLDFSGEEDLGVAAVAVERRVRDAKARRYRDQPRRAARLRCRLPVSKNHHLGLEGPPSACQPGRRRHWPPTSSRRRADCRCGSSWQPVPPRRRRRRLPGNRTRRSSGQRTSDCRGRRKDVDRGRRRTAT